MALIKGTIVANITNIQPKISKDIEIPHGNIKPTPWSFQNSSYNALWNRRATNTPFAMPNTDIQLISINMLVSNLLFVNPIALIIPISEVRSETER